MSDSGWTRRFRRLVAGTLTFQRFDAIVARAERIAKARRDSRGDYEGFVASQGANFGEPFPGEGDLL